MKTIKNTKKNFKRITFDVTEDQHKDLKLAAFSNSLTIKDFLNKIIKFYVEKKDDFN